MAFLIIYLVAVRRDPLWGEGWRGATTLVAPRRAGQRSSRLTGRKGRGTVVGVAITCLRVNSATASQPLASSSAKVEDRPAKDS